MDSTDKTGRSYESLTQAIFQRILEQDAVPNVRVERDIELKGKSTVHQIDVYWKFVLGGVTYETIVEAKDWNKPVDQSKLLAFKEVLDDLPGQPRGIFVTRTGYQAGAKQVATANGIILYELEEAPSVLEIRMTTLGWIDMQLETRRLRATNKKTQQTVEDGIVFGTQHRIFEPEISNLTYLIDKLWMEQHFDPLNLPTVELRPTVRYDEVLFYDERHSQVGKLDDLLRSEIRVMMKQEKVYQKHIAHSFEHDTFIGRPPLISPPFLKVKGLSVDIHMHMTCQAPPTFTSSKFVQFVLREIGSQKTYTFIKPREPTVG